MSKRTTVSILKLRPIHLSKIWGGSWLKKEFGFRSKGANIGESWLISAHPAGDCRVFNSIYKGKTLSQLYDLRRDLFADDTRENFPLLVKFMEHILGATHTIAMERITSELPAALSVGISHQREWAI